ncbi:MAG TPA: hypothetical protein PLA90_07730, partial [Candidatus Sumerlaeota bacterium]|nr:hypothetical protein [Candidatus Sumerlaeota bacterium]HPS01417.1 hypothetical protein [Candidatus Sumerlaeota bacterium]
PENGHFWEGGRLARLKEKPNDRRLTAVFWFTGVFRKKQTTAEEPLRFSAVVQMNNEISIPRPETQSARLSFERRTRRKHRLGKPAGNALRT